MGSVKDWTGGDELNKKLDKAGLLSGRYMANSLHGTHDIIRQLLGEVTNAIGVKHDEIPRWNTLTAGKKMYFKPKFVTHYQQFVTEVRHDVGNIITDMPGGFEKFKELDTAHKMLKKVEKNFSSCKPKTIEAEFFKRQVMECDNINEVELLNKAMSSVHQAWEHSLTKSIRGTRLGDSPAKEQCMFIVPKNGETPEFVKNLCNVKVLSDNPDMSMVGIVCKDRANIFLRRLDVARGENEGLHTTEIQIRPKGKNAIILNPNLNEDVREQYERLIRADLDGYVEDDSGNAVISITDKNLEKTAGTLGDNLPILIRPNTGMPMKEYALEEEDD